MSFYAVHAVERPYDSVDVAAAEQSEPVDHTLLSLFNERFHAKPASTPECVRIAHRIRYQVYCIENGYEDPDRHDHLETDEFDSHAAHGLLHCRKSSNALGTVRLILPLGHDPHDSFAVQRVLHREIRSEFNRLPLHAMGEVSRFSISRHISRTSDSTDLTGQIAASANSGPLMRLGLIQALIRMCIENGITHWCAAMEPTLLRMLSAMAIRFKPVGPLVDYHGRRQPCYCVVADVLNAVRRERPAFWSVLTNGGALAY